MPPQVVELKLGFCGLMEWQCCSIALRSFVPRLCFAMATPEHAAAVAQAAELESGPQYAAECCAKAKVWCEYKCLLQPLIGMSTFSRYYFWTSSWEIEIVSPHIHHIRMVKI